jgi:hydrogenase nickel incorporation protein HypB
MQHIPIERKILTKNDEAARENRAEFAARGLLALNVMSAPGAGKTSVLEQTIGRLKDRYRFGVIEGDLQTDLDARRIQALGVEAHQITTGTCCHLDARMIYKALGEFPVESFEVLVIENVGNLVCPAEFDLGEDLRIMVYSTVEGAEKPKKYPLMFHTANAILLNKIDLLPYAGVPLEELVRNVREVNPTAPLFPVSCRTGEGLADWIAWLEAAIHNQQLTRSPECASPSPAKS